VLVFDAGPKIPQILQRSASASALRIQKREHFPGTVPHHARIVPPSRIRGEGTAAYFGMTLPAARSAARTGTLADVPSRVPLAIFPQAKTRNGAIAIGSLLQRCTSGTVEVPLRPISIGFDVRELKTSILMPRGFGCASSAALMRARGLRIRPLAFAFTGLRLPVKEPYRRFNDTGRAAGCWFAFAAGVATDVASRG
jgi:hypothetical protein